MLVLNFINCIVIGAVFAAVALALIGCLVMWRNEQ